MQGLFARASLPITSERPCMYTSLHSLIHSYTHHSSIRSSTHSLTYPYTRPRGYRRTQLRLRSLSSSLINCCSHTPTTRASVEMTSTTSWQMRSRGWRHFAAQAATQHQKAVLYSRKSQISRAWLSCANLWSVALALPRVSPSHTTAISSVFVRLPYRHSPHLYLHIASAITQQP